MEILQLVRVRRQRWRVAEIRPYESCQIVTLDGAEPRTSGLRRRVIAPYERIDAVDANNPNGDRARPRRVTARRWRRACRALLAADTPPGALRSARRARIDLLSHQLEPAMAILRGIASRVLLADDVGLGKTIQAGLIVAELRTRGAIERALVLAPAGVRDQWATELSERFGLPATVADARSLREAVARLPVSVNPWATLPIAIASVDYVKRPEVLPSLLACRWDVIVVDEAHAAAGDSDRHEAVHALASRAPYVLLLTATPHSGDTRAFERLCATGVDVRNDRLLVFRRSRQEVRGDAVRRIHTLRVRPTALEQTMHSALAVYQRAVRAEHGDRALALSVLDKRAWSSAWSLAQSAAKRLNAAAPMAADAGVQLGLPFADPDGELTADDDPPAWPEGLTLADAAHEQRLLTMLLEAARAAARSGESKLRLLRRLLRRVTEPILVFTEYRDTAFHLRERLGPAALLHGGMTRDQREEVVDRFSRGADPLLIATDAAGQGLNLHRACRIVVNLELPWNPMRLEQRIGRVDRIGQSRRVHAFHVVGTGTGEDAILDRLKARISTAQRAIATPDPLDAAEPDVTPAGSDTVFMTADLVTTAVTEARRIEAARRFEVASSAHVDWDLALPAAGPWILRARRSPLRIALAGQAIFIYLLRTDDATGRIVEFRLVPILEREALAERLVLRTARVPPSLLDDWQRRVHDIVAPFWATRCAREHAIAASQLRTVSPFQASLFDRRSERAHALEQAADADRQRESASRLAALERQSTLIPPVAQLVLVVLPWKPWKQ